MSDTKAVPDNSGERADRDWANWLRIGAVLRDGPVGQGDLSGRDDALSGVELLIGAQRWDQMRPIADGPLETVDRVKVHTDVIQRLDRGCAGYTAITWQSAITGGAAIYHFAPRD